MLTRYEYDIHSISPIIKKKGHLFCNGVDVPSLFLVYETEFSV